MRSPSGQPSDYFLNNTFGEIFPELSLTGFPESGQSERMILTTLQLDPGKEGGRVVDIGE